MQYIIWNVFHEPRMLFVMYCAVVLCMYIMQDTLFDKGIYWQQHFVTGKCWYMYEDMLSSTQNIPCHAGTVYSQQGMGNHFVGLGPGNHCSWITSTVYWCIASKLKAPWNFYWMSNMFLWVEIFLFFVCYHVVPKRHSQLDYELNGL